MAKLELSPNAREGETPDEQVVGRVLGGELSGEAVPDATLIVADGTTLARGLGLVAELLQTRRPTALVVTMIDEVRARGMRLDLDKLSRILGIPVLGVVGSRGVGVAELRELLEHGERARIRGVVEDDDRADPVGEEPQHRADTALRQLGGVVDRDHDVDARARSSAHR